MGESIGLLRRVMVASGLLPEGHRAIAPDIPKDGHADLLPWVIQAWCEAVGAATHSAVRHRAARQRDRFQGAAAEGARLTVDIPGSVAGSVEGWLGHRLAWWPRGIPAGRRIGLASSRFGSAPDEHAVWFMVLRAACEKIDRDRDLLLSAPATTTARYVERCAALFGLRVLRIEVPGDDTMPFDKWFDSIELQMDNASDYPRDSVFLSPPFRPLDGLGNTTIGDIPIRDRAIVALSDQLFVFRVRRNGYLDHLVRTRLATAAWPIASLYVAIGPELVRTEMADELMALGAIGWLVFLADDSEERGSRTTRPRSQRRSNMVPMSAAEDWPYLAHCTRRRKGPWPDQRDMEYLDDLILNRAAADHSVLAALCRIVRQKRIIASSLAIRGGTSVVSFTGVPLPELHRLRVFRPHRGRWDFEPYGICIRRSDLEQLGAQPVQYGDNRLWAELAPDQRPFFQCIHGKRATGGKSINWSIENEWRIVGDVDLTALPPGAIRLFVPTEADADTVAAICDWPVIVLEH